jgi:hypothetical protein
MYERLFERCLTEYTCTAPHHMNACTRTVAVWVSDSSLVQLERRRQSVWEVAGAPATLRCFVSSLLHPAIYLCSRPRLKCDGTRAETRFRLSAKWTSPFKSAGASVQSTTGSRGVRISGSNSEYTMFRGSV